MEKKKTILFIELLNNISNDQRSEVFQKLGEKKLTDNEKVEYIKLLYDQYNVLLLANKLKEYYYQKALDNLSNLVVGKEFKNKLMDFSNNLMNRRY